MKLSAASVGLAIIHGAVLLVGALLLQSLGFSPVPWLVVVAIWHGAEHFEIRRYLAAQAPTPQPSMGLERVHRENMEEQIALLRSISNAELPDEDESFTPNVARSYISALQSVAHNTVWAYERLKRSTQRG